MRVSGGVVRADRRGEADPVFTTEGGVTLLPVDRTGLLVAGNDRTSDLAAGRAVRVLPADGSAAEAHILLWMPSGPPGALLDPLALYLELRAPTAIMNGWVPLAPADVPTPAVLSWWYRNTAGQIAPWPAPVDDGTGGLRRSGVVRLPIPPDWDFEPGSTILGLSAFAVRVRTERATFTAPPRVSRVVPNVVVARHRRAVTRRATSSSWLPLPGNVVRAARGRHAADRRERASSRLTRRPALAAVDAGRPTSPFAGPADRVFVVDREAGLLRFGDGLNGRIPRPHGPAASTCTVTYDVGGGARRQPGRGAGVGPTRARGARCTTWLAAEGGTEPETLAAARQRAGEELRRVTRAVAQSRPRDARRDHTRRRASRARTPRSDITRCTRARRCPGTVTVFVVPDAPRDEPSELCEDAFVAAPRPDPGALTAARARLDAARLVSTRCACAGPSTGARRCASTCRPIRAMPARSGDAWPKRLQRFLDPLVGGDDGGGLAVRRAASPVRAAA